MRFIADNMLGTLAKWLRVMGFDTVYAAGLDDGEILRLAQTEDRTVISRDRELCSRKPGSVFLETTELDAQILSVLALFEPPEDGVLSRCLECNTVLQEVTKEEAAGNIPEGVLLRHDGFWKCPDCGRFYWPGTHWQNMMKKAGELTASRNSPR